MIAPATEIPIEAVFAAMSDKTRLRILALLRGGELCVCDLVNVLQVPQPTASRHLAYLRKTGLVRTRRDGHWSYYRLAPVRDAERKKLMVSLMQYITQTPEAGDDAKRLAVQRCNPGCCD